MLKLTIGDQEVSFNSQGFLLWHLAEQELCRLRREAFVDATKILATLPAGLAERATLEAYRDFINTCIVTPQELEAWLASHSGRIYWFTLLIHAADHAATSEAVNVAYSKITNPQWSQLDQYVADTLKGTKTE